MFTEKFLRVVILGVSLMLSTFLSGCSSKQFTATVPAVDLQRFMGTWYVWTGRTTFLEKDAHNAVEIYTWNAEKQRIDIGFTFNKGSLDGELKSIPQKAWIENPQTNAHWKVSPFWPLKFDYLVIGLDPDYQWTAIGVPSGKYLWIMGRNPQVADSKLQEIVQTVSKTGYPVENLTVIPHR
jgi:apolipoprotein D and lipocalin family protein